MSLEGEKLQVMKSIDKHLAEDKTVIIVPSEAMIRAVALVAAALQPHPGPFPLFERTGSYVKYIREGVLGDEE